MRLAVIDMGTNTFNLIISELYQNQFEILFSTKEPVKLGQKLKTLHRIDSQGIQRIIQVLKKYLNIVEEYSVKEIIALATSSIRTAQNQQEVLDIIKQETGIQVHVIDGDREAELIYLANKYAIDPCINQSLDTPYLIMDIGGGSTEFIIFNNDNCLWKKSFLLGMARLIDELKPQDPITQQDIDKAYNYLNSHLQELAENVSRYSPKILVGSSGVFDSIVEMIEANIHPLHKNPSCCKIDLKDFYTIFNQILPLPYQDRLQYKGLIPMRADMIIMSLLIIDYVLKTYKIEELIVSFYSLKEGVIIEKMKYLS